MTRRPRYSLDTEFRATGSTIDLISVGLVCEDGREIYRVCADFDQAAVARDGWLREHVWRHLPLRPCPWWHLRLCNTGGAGHLDTSHPDVASRTQIADQIAAFLGGEEAQVWADYGAYDFVAVSGLWGALSDKPAGWPWHVMDLRQEIKRLGLTPDQLPPSLGRQHHALADAYWNLTALTVIDHASTRKDTP